MSKSKAVVRRDRRKKKGVPDSREKRRLVQLLVCLALFAAALFSKGIGALAEFRRELGTVLTVSIDPVTVLQDLRDRFLPEALPEEAEALPVPSPDGTGRVYLALRSDPTLPPVSATEGPQNDSASTAMELSRSLSAAQAEAEPEAMPAEEQEPALPSVVYVEYTGPTLPDNTTMDQYALGLQETVAPVMAHLSSGFGWRVHPIDGGDKFHYGLDLAVEVGTDVLAFAAGRVEYIGESEVYGQYLQLDHGNGVTSFYAHCSKLCVQQGQIVAAGEKVAESGATGKVTGPHLHFELKKDGVRLNPAYYIDILT